MGGLLTKEELEKERDKLEDKFMSSDGDADSAFSYGFDACADLLWPEIEKSQTINQFEQALLNQRKDLESKLDIAEEAFEKIIKERIPLKHSVYARVALKKIRGIE